MSREVLETWSPAGECSVTEASINDLTLSAWVHLFSSAVSGKAIRRGGEASLLIMPSDLPFMVLTGQRVSIV